MNGFNRNPYPMSDVRLVKGLRYINKIRSLIIAFTSSGTNVIINPSWYSKQTAGRTRLG